MEVPIFHSYRGSQYCAYDYQKKLQALGVQPSMSGKGKYYDNASVEAYPMIPRIIGCGTLENHQDRADLAAKLANAALG